MRAFDHPRALIIIRLHSHLVSKERLLLVATFQACPEFHPLLNGLASRTQDVQVCVHNVLLGLVLSPQKRPLAYV